MASVPRKSGSQTGCITLMQPRMTTVGLEVSLHTCPKALLRELKHVFSGVGGLGECLAIPTNQHAELDLVNIGDKVEKEKDRLLNTFVTFASSVCEKIRQEGYWADYIDPCSGLPVMTLKYCFLFAPRGYSTTSGVQQFRSWSQTFCDPYPTPTCFAYKKLFQNHFIPAEIRPDRRYVYVHELLHLVAQFANY
ncbi:unnamed protein product [Choristocarpus tenellus]